MLLPRSPDRRPDPPPQSPQLALRIAVLGGLALALVGVLVFRLWSLQVLASDQYGAIARQQNVKIVDTPARRGRILDIKGRVLVRNRPGLQLELDPAVLSTADKRWPVLRRVARLLGTTAATLEKRVQNRLLLRPLEPVTLARDVDEELFVVLAENSDDYRGIRVREVSLRYYPNKALASHVFGELREINEVELEENPRFQCYGPNRCYKPGDVIGASGVEGAYDRFLRGTDGRLRIPVDASGTPTGPGIAKPAEQAGYDLRLTIDRDVQRAAEAALQEGIRRGYRGGADAGAIIAMDPDDGAIRAIASAPDFNPNWIVSREKRAYREEVKHLYDPKRTTPALLNRAIGGLYAAGSTFKPFTAIAAVNEGLIDAATPLPCVPKLKIIDTTFPNWDRFFNSPISLSTALARSCNTYFYELGARIFELANKRGNPIQRTARQFGLGKPTGIDIAGEGTGLLPTPAWKRTVWKKGTWDYDWHPGDSANLAVGQGALQVTPIQMAVAYSAIANGGNVVTPHIGERIERGGELVRGIGTAPKRRVNVDEYTLREIRAGLDQVTHADYGTGRKAFAQFAVDVAGKTGTAEMPGGDYAWFASYAPANDPQIVVVVLVEKAGHGGAIAAPAALRFYCNYFGARCPVLPDDLEDKSF